jgi:hypothetical protein
MMLTGVAAARNGAAAPSTTPSTGTCTVISLPSFVATGEFSNSGTVADVIEVSCDPYTYSAGAPVTVTASQLFSRCHEDISWYEPNVDGEPVVVNGERSVTLSLDINGNANVGLIAGPGCMAGESLITVDEDESPYETYMTTFQVEPTKDTPEGLTITPEKQVEDQSSSAVITIAQAEFENAPEKTVRIGAGQLYDRCKYGHKLNIIRENREIVSGSEDTAAISLDDNSSGFVLLEGGESCAKGTSLIEGDLTEAPFTTLLPAEFTIESPRVRPEGK